jgi:hypothetical protein
MKSFNTFLQETVNNTEVTESKKDSTFYASLNIENVEVLYQKAMRTKNSSELEKNMISMKNKFPDGSKIDFSEVEWDKVYTDLNEAVALREEALLLEAEIADALNIINNLIDKANKTKNKKTLKVLYKALDKILNEIM